MTATNDPCIIKCHFALNPGSRIVDISMESNLKIETPLDKNLKNCPADKLTS